MTTGRKFAGKRLAIISAFTVLLVAAFGAGCAGFFVNPTIASFIVSPTSPTVAYPNGTLQMSAFGTNSDGSAAGNITNQIDWSSGSPGVISVGTSGDGTPGLLTAVSLGTSAVTITANYQALAVQTASATVCVTGGSDLTIAPLNYVDSTGATTQDYTAAVTVNESPQDVTASVMWTTTNSAVTIADGTSPAVATITLPTAPPAVTGTVTATYTCAGNTLAATTDITIDPAPSQ